MSNSQPETTEAWDSPRRSQEALDALRAKLRPARQPTTPGYIRRATRFRPMGVRQA